MRKRIFRLVFVWWIVVPFAMAPANQMPEQISGAQPEWDGKCAWPFCGGLVAEVVDESDTIVRQIVYGPVGPMWQVHTDGTSEYMHLDARGNIAMLTVGVGPPTRASGDVLERVTFDPYGLPRFQDAANADKSDRAGNYLAESDYGNTQLFGGLWYEPETGLRTNSVGTDRAGCYRLGGALYNPDEGRVASRPPVPTAQTVHLHLESNGSDSGGESGHAHGHLDYLKQIGDPATAAIAVPNLVQSKKSGNEAAPVETSWIVVRSPFAAKASSANSRAIKKLTAAQASPIEIGKSVDARKSRNEASAIGSLRTISNAQTAAIAIPNLLDARKSGNESSAIGSLRTISNAQTAAIAIPNLLDARKSGNESSAIGVLRTVDNAQALFGDDDELPDFLDTDDDSDSASQANRRYLYFAKTADADSSCWIRVGQLFSKNRSTPRSPLE